MYFGYPLVPLGKRTPRPTDHLARIDVPQLFFAGTRDRLGPPDLVSRVAGGLGDAEVVVIAEADHSFAVPKRVRADHSGDTRRAGGDHGDWIRRSIRPRHTEDGGGV